MPEDRSKIDLQLFAEEPDERTILISYSYKQDYPEGKLLKELRELYGIQQKEIAAQLNITAPTLSNHEKREKVNKNIKEQYLNVLGIPPKKFDYLRKELEVLDCDLQEFVDNNEFYRSEIKQIQASNSAEERKNRIDQIKKMLEVLDGNYLDEVYSYTDNLHRLQKYESEERKKE